MCALNQTGEAVLKSFYDACHYCAVYNDTFTVFNLPD